jgi:signal peptidase I
MVSRVERRNQARRNPRRGRRLIWLANIVLIVVCSLTGVAALGNAAGWWRTDTVLTGSMRPGIQPGDVEILRHEATGAIHVGQIVAFHPPHDQFTVSHRVIGIHHRHGLWITTKGDANNVPDPWGSVRVLGSSAWVVTGVVPHVGYLSVWVRTPLPHLLLVLTIVLLVCALALEAIWRT